MFIRMKIKSFSCETFSTSTRSKEANGNLEVEVKSACICMCQAAHQASTFCSMKWLEVFLLPPGWDASPLQGYLQHLICQYLFIHLRRYWGTVRVKCLAQGPRLLEIEKKYKNQITGYLHRLLITFKMYNNVFWFELEHCFQITLYKMKSLIEFTIFTSQSRIDT